MQRSLACLLIGAFLIRAGWGLHQPADEQSLANLPDQREYFELGRNLLEHGELKFRDPRFGADVYAYRAPGYPLLVASCGANLRFLRAAQAAIDTSTILAVYVLARRWLSQRGSFFAALVVAINPFLIYFSGLILSETLFIAMLAWGMALLRFRFAGVWLLALSILARPSALMLPLLLVIPKPRMIVLSLAAILLVLLPWAWRNHTVLGRWVWTTTNAGITSYDGLNPQADGSSNQSFVLVMPELKTMSEIERSDYLARRASEYAREKPGRAIELAARKVARTWSPIPLSREFGSRKLYVIAAAIYSVPFDILVIMGLWRGSLPRRAKVFLLLPAIYFTIAHAISVGSLRYRIPADVPLAVIVASCRLSVARRATNSSSLATGNC